MNKDDYFSLSRELEKHHAVFYKLWEMGEPIWTESVPTAGVSFEPLRYYFNPKFYKSIDLYTKAFVVAHESMHILLNHGTRLKKCDHRTANIAMDIALHEIMFNRMGFERNKVQIDGIATRKFVCPQANKNESAEYYYNYIMKNPTECNPVMVDDHSFHGVDTSKIIEDINNQLSNEDAKTFNNSVKGDIKKEGKEVGGRSQVFKIKPVKKRKWEKIIKDWTNRNDELDPEYQWAIPDRRKSLLPKDFLLPSIYKNKPKNERITVFFYQDSSGSCSNLAERFFKAARSIPEDKFDVRLFCFDTQVYSVDKNKGELYGFGGTSFDIIEQHVQDTIKKEHCKYPTVWIVTDGFGNPVKPKHPNKWYWLLTEHSSKNYIPKESKLFDLKEFE